MKVSFLSVVERLNKTNKDYLGMQVLLNRTTAALNTWLPYMQVPEIEQVEGMCTVTLKLFLSLHLFIVLTLSFYRCNLPN